MAVAVSILFGGAVIFFAVWLARALYDQYRERIIFFEVAIVFAAFGALLLLTSKLSERLAALTIVLFSCLVFGYCAWRGKRRARLKGIRLRKQLEDEYLAMMDREDCDKAKAIAMIALGEFPNVGAVDYFRNYAHISTTIESGMSSEEQREWYNRWQVRLGR